MVQFKEPVDIKVDGKTIIFQSTQEIDKLFTEEQEFWKQLWSGRNPDPEYQTLMNTINSPIQEWNQAKGNYVNNPEAMEGQARRIVKSMYAGGGIPHSTSIRAKYILKILEDMDKRSALIAAQMICGIQVDIRQYRYFYVASKLAALELGLTKGSSESVKKSINAALSSVDVFISERRAQAEAVERQIQDAIAKNEKVVSGSWSRVVRKILRNKIKIAREATNSTQNLRRLEATYREHMALSAPVAYWKNKASEHKENADTYRVWILTYAGLGLAGTLIALSILFSQSLSADTDRVSTHLILVTMGIFISTVVLWGGRIFVRLFLSEHHLALDAAERATMVNTYLALTEVAKVDEKDRELVLGPLFRPTADGIVKDDGGPDLSPSGALSRILSR